jgi:hypothetical protein
MTTQQSSMRELDLATAARVVVYGGQGSDAVEQIRARYPTRFDVVHVVDAEHALDADAFVAAIEACCQTTTERVLILVAGATAGVITDEDAFCAMDVAAGDACLIVFADVAVPDGWTPWLVGLSLDAGGRPSAAVRQVCGGESDEAAAWLELSDGWVLAAEVAAELLARFGTSLQPEPQTWLQFQGTGTPRLADVLERSWDLLDPDAQDLLSACVRHGPLLSGQALAKVCAAQGVSLSLLDLLCQTGWLQEARTPVRGYWWLPWLRVHWLMHALGMIAPSEEWGREERETFQRVLVDDLLHERRLHPAELTLASRLAAWSLAGQDASMEASLLRGTVALEARSLVEACRWLEHAWWVANESSSVRALTVSALLLAEAFARRDDIARARRYLRSAQPSVGSDGELAHQFLEVALSPTEKGSHAERRLHRLMRSVPASRWLPMVELTLDILADAGRFEEHSALLEHVDRALEADAPRWLSAHRALARTWSTGATMDALAHLRSVGADDPIAVLVRVDLLLLSGEFAQAQRGISAAVRSARAEGLPARELTFLLRDAIVHRALDRAVPPSTIQQASAVARRLGRKDVRQLMTALANPESGIGATAETSPLLRAALAPPRLDEGTVLGPPLTFAPLTTERPIADWILGAARARRDEVDPELLDVAHETLVIDSAHRWVVIGGEQAHDLRRHGLYGRLLQRLIQARGDAPDEHVSIDELVDALWPDERMSLESAANRFHKTLSTFRKQISRELLERHDDGYCIPSRWRVVVVEGRLAVAVCNPDATWHHDARAILRQTPVPD